MASRKKTEDGGAKKKSGKFLSGIFSRIGKIFLLLLAFFLGGIVFNLDRAGEAGIMLLKYKHLVPSPFHKLLPGYGVANGLSYPEQIIHGQIIEVYDGDTVTLLTSDPANKFKVRFFGIDAPEMEMEHGKISKNALQDKILGRQVSVKVVNVDNYGRTVGKVMFGTRYINLEMVSEGNAWYYADYAKNEYDLSAAEKEAKSFRRGLWQNSAPLPPWEFRRSRK